jgi:hypothetical protein
MIYSPCGRRGGACQTREERQQKHREYQWNLEDKEKRSGHLLLSCLHNILLGNDDHFLVDGFAKSPSAALRSSFVTAAYLYVRLIPQLLQALHLELFVLPSG